MSSNEKGAYFRSLHRATLALFNVWDAGSSARRPMRAPSHWRPAAGRSRRPTVSGDGEQMPRALMMDVLERITRATDLPVTVDLESGYGERPEDVAETIALSIKAGAIGCNLEDSFPATGELRDVDAAAARLAAARQAADRAGADYFINARTDVFFTAPADTHDERLLDATLARARAYAAAGADGLFVPGLAACAHSRADGRVAAAGERDARHGDADARRIRGIRRGPHQPRAVSVPAGDEDAGGDGQARRLTASRSGRRHTRTERLHPM